MEVRKRILATTVFGGYGSNIINAKCHKQRILEVLFGRSEVGKKNNKKQCSFFRNLYGNLMSWVALPSHLPLLIGDLGDAPGTQVSMSFCP